MYDRPTASELIAAARHHIETALVPLAKSANHKLYFQTLVAVNVLRIVERELALQPSHVEAEWARLNLLLGEQPLPASPTARLSALGARNAALCAAIRAGHYDHNAELFRHLVACATEQLEVANPKWLASG